ncbi:AAA domain-containing protein [Streptomyces cacaoi]|uniref:Protein kinase domain-containing protein n=1 Tax=Streptomyces cacaoi TaxID=1898 RepID=A0A4Y3R8Z9_STRCI|nr:AAA domain-containing protein [Streptomyces cacaoi]NNG89406.1 hypothetical protein [Streptomyces cacaoi]GEB53839.1 hypothetical protein SCA03_63900 [Streptomyces cacaoi]
MALEDMDRLVTDLFCGPESPYGSFELPGGRPAHGTELLPGTLYRYGLLDRATRTPVTVQFYLGVSGLGERLWKQELRVLQRVAALRHPALPEIQHGGHIEESVTEPFGIRGCAYVVTRSGDGQVYDESDEDYGLRAGYVETIATLRSDRGETVAHFMSLADALSVLHDMGIVHRNIWPGTVGWTQLDGDEYQLVLSRFEMSSLVSNLLRSSLLDSNERAKQARELILAQGGDALAYFSPERIRFLLADGARLEDHRSDVYSLGMMVAEWMTGPIPEELLAEVGAAMAAGPDLDRLLAAAGEVNRHLAAAVHELPGPLRTLLRDMLAWEKPTGRPSATDVVGRLSDHYEHLTSDAEQFTGSDYLLVFVPAESRKTLLKWELVDLDPATEHGRIETVEFILGDLKDARLLHMPGGAAPFVPGQEVEKLYAADQLLLGRDIGWFCRPFAPEVGLGRRGGPDERGLLLTYPVQLDSARGRSLRVAADKVRKHRWVPPVRIVASDIDRREMRAELESSPSWRPLMDAVREVAPPTRAERAYGQAFDWLLQFQRTELESRQYPYIAEGAGRQDQVVLRYDEERDQRWRFGSAMATAFANTPGLRPPMGDFFAGAGGEDGAVPVTLRGDDRGAPARHAAFTGDCVEANNETVVVAAGRRTGSVPERGWITLADDFGAWMALSRQEQARWELLDNRVLVEQLAKPNAVHTVRLTKRSGNAEVARALSSTEPLFALQGPPGTGKTEVTSDAIVRYLEDERGTRVLVSTQSNFALDNIAERLLRKLGLLEGEAPVAQAGSDVIAVRATGARGESKVHPLVEPFLIHKLAERRQREIVAGARERLREAADESTRRLLADWCEVVEAGLPELIDRLHRAANLVFATCSSATPATLARSAAADIFDWVVIEEAAKAWPTELAIPLARGTRWSLVGDHRQLPAHRRREVLRFLEACAASTDEDLRVHGERQEDYRKVFGLFDNLFVDDPSATVAHPPRHTLRTQYRMRPAIGEIVSRAFYPLVPPEPGEHVDIDAEGMLATGRDDTGVLREPPVLARNTVVWLDTTGLPECSDEPAWCNPGEVRIVNAVVESLRPRPVPGKDGYGDHPIAVLTPYRRQLDLFKSWGEIRPHASTIHAFQGREANAVVVSLVRDQQRGAPEQPWRSIGHLNEPELVNVLFSRAREHLVVVGSFAHFSRYGGAMWADVCALVERYGRVVPAGELGVV